MNAGILCLVLGYVLSQFYRAFLAVLAPDLYSDLGITPETLATASGVWFLTFAAMQIPVGVALDKIGPKTTASLLLAVGGAGGAFLFSIAENSNQIILAMGLIGIGCSPILMSAYYIFARSFSPKIFATLAGVSLGLGTMGNVASALPLTFAVQALGWRGAILSLAFITFAISILIYVYVKNPEKLVSKNKERTSVISILKMPIIWPIIVIMSVTYAPAAGIRGLWISPYLSDVFMVSNKMIGTATLIMGLAMILGSFVYGPLDRIFISKKKIIFADDLVMKEWDVEGAILFSDTIQKNKNAYGIKNEKNKRYIVNHSGLKVEITDVNLLGKHNQLNIMAAVATFKQFDNKFNEIDSAIKKFPVINNRLEWVRKVNGINFYNDSKATNISSAISAVNAFEGKNIFLIVGGDSKNQDLSLLSRALKSKIKKLYLIGKDAELIKNACKNLKKVEIKILKTMKEATYQAFKNAESGDVVLLAPACASYDMYRSYIERGNDFKSIVANF